VRRQRPTRELHEATTHVERTEIETEETEALDEAADLGLRTFVVARVEEDAGVISLCYASATLLPSKTRAFVDHVVEEFRRQRLAERFSSHTWR
jgi:hypothetical protein